MEGSLSAAEPPLPALLSAALVAFTIEADNHAERRIAHHTTSGGGEHGTPWLTSLAMWFNCLGPLAAAGEPLTVAELSAHARMDTNLDGMRRWGYITIDGVGRVRPGAHARPRARPGSVLALTDRGEASAALWDGLPAVIETRWRKRFGAAVIDRLRAALVAIAQHDATPLPDFMPIGDIAPRVGPRSDAERAADARLGLVSLLARALMRFTLDHDAGPGPPLLGWSNLLRVLDAERALAVADLPGRTGIARESQAVLTRRGEQAGAVTVSPRPGTARGRELRLTARGARARVLGTRRIEETTREWARRMAEVPALIDTLRALVGDGSRARSPLASGLAPPPEGWRAQMPAAETLPWYPMVTHRGGYPDGA